MIYFFLFRVDKLFFLLIIYSFFLFLLDKEFGFLRFHLLFLLIIFSFFLFLLNKELEFLSFHLLFILSPFLLLYISFKAFRINSISFYSFHNLNANFIVFLFFSLSILFHLIFVLIWNTY